MTANTKLGLVEHLNAGENIFCAEGYLFELSRRGYIAHGVFVPEFILEQPEVLKNLHYEMAHAGSDVIEAFQVQFLSYSSLHVMYLLVHFILSSTTLIERRCGKLVVKRI